jgi:hypothetical protein
VERDEPRVDEVLARDVELRARVVAAFPLDVLVPPEERLLEDDLALLVPDPLRELELRDREVPERDVPEREPLDFDVPEREPLDLDVLEREPLDLEVPELPLLRDDDFARLVRVEPLLVRLREVARRAVPPSDSPPDSCASPCSCSSPSSSLVNSFFATPAAAVVATPAATPAAIFFVSDVPSSFWFSSSSATFTSLLV